MDPCYGVISAQHGAVQQEEVESGLLLRLKVKYVSENNVNGFLSRQITWIFPAALLIMASAGCGAASQKSEPFRAGGWIAWAKKVKEGF